MLENAEEIMHSLEEFSKLKPKMIPRELEDYLGYVAKTGDPVFKWSMVKYLFREKMLSVINDFYEDTLTIDLPPCPNVDAFNYDRMKTSLLERLESFHGAPFTIQRICELLTNPRKEYNRADKFMRAMEKNILVVSTREPGRYSDLDCENTQECSINGIREVGDPLDTTFIINDLGPGPDSSSPSAEINDSLPEANHLNTVERVSPVHDQEVSSDSDDSSLENGHISVDAAAEKTNCLDNEQPKPVEESDGTNVSSTDMRLSSEENNTEAPCEETAANPVSSSHESVISNEQQIEPDFVVEPSLGEVMGAVEGSGSMETLEPCILPDINEVMNEPSTNTARDQSESEPDASKSDVTETPVSSEKDSETHPVISTPAGDNTEAVECDTSQNDRSMKCDNGAVNPSSIVDESEVPCDTNDQVICDTTEPCSEITTQYLDSNEVQAESHGAPSSKIIQSNVEAPDAAQSDTVPSENTLSDSAQSDVIDQSDVAQLDAAINSSVAESDTGAHHSDVAQSGIETSDIIDQSDSVLSSNIDRCEAVAITSGGQTERIEDSGPPEVKTEVEQLNVINSESVQSDVTPKIDIVELCGAEAQSLPVDQSCNDISSEDLASSEPMAQSSISDAADSNQPDDGIQPRIVDQNDQVVQMEVPVDSENVMDSSQPNQPLFIYIPSEPMDVDE